MQSRNVVGVPIRCQKPTRHGGDQPLLTGFGKIAMSNHPRGSAEFDTARVVANPCRETDRRLSIIRRVTRCAVRYRRSRARTSHLLGINEAIIPGSSYAPGDVPDAVELELM